MQQQASRCRGAHRNVRNLAAKSAIVSAGLSSWSLLHGAGCLEGHTRLNLGPFALALGCKPAVETLLDSVTGKG